MGCVQVTASFAPFWPLLCSTGQREMTWGRECRYLPHTHCKGTYFWCLTCYGRQAAWIVCVLQSDLPLTFVSCFDWLALVQSGLKVLETHFQVLHFVVCLPTRHKAQSQWHRCGRFLVWTINVQSCRRRTVSLYRILVLARKHERSGWGWFTHNLILLAHSVNRGLCLDWVRR